ncbi:hypothetical protein WOSG25_190260 [Weissella oryzae SG25]|uniref:Uncharacterized protein n=1 Tax=Weissella oryzae (strain DSM 25784 / JCM 18191 / LMG 30913 / SG25) TaxID=1329250 RepID=A0A069CXG4_WEIOS|nr:hypothetical protein [Weissella oryzae]GAK31918.1 hypothetical protein WOSG25_190260 [Weissella oryzae SG25]
MINAFKSLSLLGSSVGTLTYIGPDVVGRNSDVKVAQFNVGDSFETIKVTPQVAFDFNRKFGETMRLIDAKIIAGEARTNARAGARVATYSGTILTASSNEQDKYSIDEYDALFVTGKKQHVVGRVRSADAFNRHDLILFSIAPNYKADDRNGVARDTQTDEPIISNYQFNFIPKSKANGEVTEEDYIRILVKPEEYDRVIEDLKPGQQVYPQGLKFAFVGNTSTDWTVYADQIDLVPSNQAAGTTPKADSKPASEVKSNGSEAKKN